MNQDPALRSRTAEETTIVISASEHEDYLLDRSFQEALGRFLDTTPGHTDPALTASLGSLEDIDAFLDGHTDLTPEAGHFLSICKLKKEREKKGPIEEGESITLTGSQAEEYQDFQLYKEMLRRSKEADASRQGKDTKVVGRGVGSLALADGEGLSSYLNQHWTELTPAEVEYIEAMMRLAIRGINSAKYPWA